MKKRGLLATVIILGLIFIIVLIVDSADTQHKNSAELQDRILVLEKELGFYSKDATITKVYTQNTKVKHGTTIDDLFEVLPKSVKVLLDEDRHEYLNVNWTINEEDFDGENTGLYVVYGQINLLDGIFNPDELKAKLHITVPANIWINTRRKWDFDFNKYISSHEIEVTNLQANDSYNVDVIRGKFVDGSAIGQTIYERTVMSDHLGKIELEIHPSVQLTAVDIIVVSLSSENFVGTHGLLPYCPIATRRVSKKSILGEISFPEGWNKDYYVGKINVNGTESYSGYELSTYPIYYSRASDFWYVDNSEDIWNSMTGTFEVHHEYGGGARLYWEVPECEWAGQTTSWLFGLDSKSNYIYFELNGVIETDLTQYSWPSEYYPNGHFSGSAIGEFEVTQDEKYYDTFLMESKYGEEPHANTLAGNLLREDYVIGEFAISLEHDGSINWSGDAYVSNLIGYEDELFYSEWFGVIHSNKSKWIHMLSR